MIQLGHSDIVRAMPIRRNAHGSRRRFASSSSRFNGNFNTLFPGAYQVLQSNLGLTYGGTPRAATTNTSTTVISLTGSVSGASVPIRAKATNSASVGAGATFDISFDGGLTFPIVGLAPAVGTPIALTGAGAGISLAWSAGSSVNADSWDATCSTLADQSSQGKNLTQVVSAALQPIVTLGLNGKCGLLFDGVDDYMQSTVGTLINVFPYQAIVVAKHLSPTGANKTLIGGEAARGTLDTDTGSKIRQYNGTGGFSVAFTSTAATRFSAKFTNSTSDALLAGSSALTGSNSGNLIGGTGNRYVGANPDFAHVGNVEVFAVIYTPPPTSLSAFDSALNSELGYGVGSIAV